MIVVISVRVLILLAWMKLLAPDLLRQLRLLVYMDTI